MVTAQPAEAAPPAEEKTPTKVIIDYERALRAQTHDTHFAATITALDDFDKALNNLSLTQRQYSEALREHWYTRFATALTSYIADPATTVKVSALFEVCIRKQAIAYIFSASGYRTMDHLLSLMVDRKDDLTTLSPQRAAVLFAFCGLDSMTDELMTLALKQPAPILLALMLGWLNQRAVLTEQGERNRGRLLTSGHLIEDAAVSDAYIGQIVNAWMYSSYASEPRKHDIKKSFNKLLTELLNRGTPHPRLLNPPERKRPLLLVIHERFVQGHAMYRCYAPYMEALQRDFDLVALAEAAQVDEVSEQLFKRVVKLPEGSKQIRNIVAQITEIGPNIIYYPSLGMSHWTVLLAQLRLAPVQFMTHGHPASSMSREIDYTFMMSLEGDIAHLHSEKLMMGVDQAAFAPHSELPEVLPALVEPSNREVRVAVNSKVMKLSPRLIAICRRLQANAKVPVRFSFFPGERGVFFDGLAAAIKSQLPSAEVWPTITYGQFLDQMCRCDLALAAFPFGNTNSTVDTSLLGLPTVAHFGPETPAQTDAMVLRTAGLPDWLICHSDDEYYETALRLINNSEERLDLMRSFDREKIRARLYAGAENHSAQIFADMVKAVHAQHDALITSGQRIYHHHDLLGS